MSNLRILFPVKDPSTQYVGAMTISGVLKREGFNDVQAVEAAYEKIAPLLSRDRLTVLAYTTPSIFCLFYLELNRRLKKDFKVFSIFGGWHPTYYPQMIEEEGVDAVCIGEGEYAMLELAQRLERGESPKDIQNLWIKENGQIFKNPLRPLIANLDELPYPDRSFLAGQASSYYETVATVITQRSCPFRCSFCVNNAYNNLYDAVGKKRRRSVDHVIGELKTIKAKGTLEFVKFEDSIFITYPDWIREFSPKYAREIGVPFICYVRAEMVTPEILQLLKDAGCASVAMGVECGDNETRKTLLNKSATNDQIVAAADLIRKYGISLRTQNILGLPGCTIEEDLKTVALNVRCRPAYSFAGLMQPYPGTAIYDYSLSKGLIPADMNEYLKSLPQGYNDSMMKFPSDMEKRMAKNLVRFFAFTVHFPFLLPMVKRLIRLPPNPLFVGLYTWWKAYCYFFKVWPVSFKSLRVLIKRYGRLA